MPGCKETICSSCIHCPVCANKNTVLDIQKQIDGLRVGETAVRVITWVKLQVACKHFRQNVPTVRDM